MITITTTINDGKDEYWCAPEQFHVHQQHLQPVDQQLNQKDCKLSSLRSENIKKIIIALKAPDSKESKDFFLIHNMVKNRDNNLKPR